MTPQKYIEKILRELLVEKGESYVKKKCEEFEAKDAQDRYRLKKQLLKFLEK